MNYRLIALDVDGTLLNDDHELTEQTIETIQEVHDKEHISYYVQEELLTAHCLSCSSLD